MTSKDKLRALLAKAEELEAKATKAPWTWTPGASLWIGEEASPDDTLSGDAILADKELVIASTHYDLEPKGVDGQLIALSRNGFLPVLRLLVERLDECNECRGDADAYGGYGPHEDEDCPSCTPRYAALCAELEALGAMEKEQ